MTNSGPKFPVSVGKCIYCGATDDLSDEHIVPYALGGEWVLRDASCGTHRDVTSRFEHAVLRGPLNIPRTILGLRTRRKAERPKTLPLTVIAGGVERHLEFPAGEHPGFFAMPVFQPPGRLEDASVTGIREPRDFVVPYREARYPNPGATLGAEAARVSFPDLIALARFIAKIGYAYTVACVGRGAIGSEGCLPSIVGEADDVGQWVGCLDEPRLTTTEGVHEAVLREADGLWLCHVRILAKLRLPEYVVVVGGALHS